MNQYKRDWLQSIGMNLTPYVKPSSSDDSITIGIEYETSVELGQAMRNTGRAIALGIAISQIDGPLPVADVIGLTVAVAMTIRSWAGYFSD